MENVLSAATVSVSSYGFDPCPRRNIPARQKVLIIAPFHRGIGGAETYVTSLMEEASKRYDVYLASLSKPPALWQGTPIWKVAGIVKELLHDTRRYLKLDIKTIDCHGLQAALVGCILSFNYHFKFCVTMLALYDFKDRPWWFRFICRMILNRADKIFVEGETGKKDLIACGVKEHKTVPFMHWVDTSVYKPAPHKHKGVNVLYVGRAIPIKGKHIIEEVERKLFYKKELHFKYIENVPHKDLIKHYQWADILVVPSQYSEGFPRVIFEAAACGCAIIASDRGALPELVRNFGIVTKYFDKEIASCVNGVESKSRLYATKFFTPKNADVILREYKCE